MFWRETARAYMALTNEELQQLPPEERKEAEELVERYKQLELRQQGMMKILFAMFVALVIGGYIGYSFTSSHYKSVQATENKRESTAVCRLELRDGNQDTTYKTYSALFEYRAGNEEFCREHIPADYLPNGTTGTATDSLQSEEDYNANN